MEKKTKNHNWKEVSEDELLWRSELDKKYIIEVRRAAAYRGTLCIFDSEDDNKKIASWSVPLSYGAKFGVDQTDIMIWQEKVMGFIDEKNKN